MLGFLDRGQRYTYGMYGITTYKGLDQKSVLELRYSNSEFRSRWNFENRAVEPKKMFHVPGKYSGGLTDRYAWVQTLQNVELKVNLPIGATGKDLTKGPGGVSCAISSKVRLQMHDNPFASQY